jgi:uncharacterized protein YecT (DUF1311 family)
MNTGHEIQVEITHRLNRTTTYMDHMRDNRDKTTSLQLQQRGWLHVKLSMATHINILKHQTENQGLTH